MTGLLIVAVVATAASAVLFYFGASTGEQMPSMLGAVGLLASFALLVIVAGGFA